MLPRPKPLRHDPPETPWSLEPPTLCVRLRSMQQLIMEGSLEPPGAAIGQATSMHGTEQLRNLISKREQA